MHHNHLTANFLHLLLVLRNTSNDSSIQESSKQNEIAHDMRSGAKAAAVSEAKSQQVHVGGKSKVLGETMSTIFECELCTGAAVTKMEAQCYKACIMGDDDNEYSSGDMYELVASVFYVYDEFDNRHSVSVVKVMFKFILFDIDQMHYPKCS